MPNREMFVPSQVLAEADQDMIKCIVRRLHDWEPYGTTSIETYKNKTVKLYRQHWICGKGCKTTGYEWIEVDGRGNRYRVGSFTYDWDDEYKKLLSEVDRDSLKTEKYRRAAPELDGFVKVVDGQLVAA